MTLLFVFNCFWAASAFERGADRAGYFFSGLAAFAYIGMTLNILVGVS